MLSYHQQQDGLQKELIGTFDDKGTKGFVISMGVKVKLEDVVA